jgi:hypothetical protein
VSKKAAAAAKAAQASALAPDHAPLLRTLQVRFEQHLPRHRDITWDEARTRLMAHPAALAALQAMETTGGEPDLTWRDAATGQLCWCDCAA